ncbi:MAG: CDP-alcohol phosphatidyltransferase family protein [Planctomycetales bacterium]|nr:CDP-alcohol phosphatidyltransferase family protein [Planctomycetales bacterium]
MSKPAYEPTDRRPIESRDTRWAASITNQLVARGVSPNEISIVGMLAAIGAGVCFFGTNHAEAITQRMLWLAGGLLCQVRLLCNLFDGMVAVQRGIASVRGELYNEVPDRVSDSAVMIGLGYAATGAPAWGLFAALVSVFVAYVRAMAKSIGAPNDFCGPMAKPQRMALTTALAVYLACSPGIWRIALGEATLVLIVIAAGGIATAIRRLRRASRYLAEAAS